MIKVTVLYPKKPGSRFDFEHYLTKHMPLSIERLGKSMSAITVDRIVPLGAPYPDPEFHAICTFECESREAFEAAFFPHMEELQSDAVNYTDSQQIILFSEIEIEHRNGVVGVAE